MGIKGQTTDRSGGKARGLFVRLARDPSGNAAMLFAAALVPLIAMVGSGVDMGRGYLAESRLQQACDAGVLAARKRLGAAAPANGLVPADVGTVGNRFFDINYRSGSYGTQARDFQMTLEPDYSISGVAKVSVPPTLMQVLGFGAMPIEVHCEARLNFANTDVMMVLDTTGSMNDTNPGDAKNKISVLRDVVKAFHAQLEAAKTPGVRIRYGFVPYSSNVNVGFLLKSKWMVDNWTYHVRKLHDSGRTQTVDDYATSSAYVSGGATTGSTANQATCPAGTLTWTTIDYRELPDGTQTWTIEVNGTEYSCGAAAEGAVAVTPTTYNRYRYTYSQKKTGSHQEPIYDWIYEPMTMDVSGLKSSNPDSPMQGGKVTANLSTVAGRANPMDSWFQGCVEERDTYQIADYANVDLAQARDLDIDSEPVAGNPATQWRPMLHDFSWLRAKRWDRSGAWSVPAVTTDADYMNAGSAGLSACPAQARKLAVMNASDVAGYVDTLVARGSTYHDIGMIWGGRLLSPTGLFAAENADVAGKPTARHMIFLTDGLTQPNEYTYGTYGVEPLDRRRWAPGGAVSQTQMVENRFGAACAEVKKRNVTVWVIGFGTTLNPVMTACAGPGRSFVATDAGQLTAAFDKIAKAMGDLRISK